MASQSSNITYESLFAKASEAVINKTKWKMMLAIESAILENGGNIFGGYVRDKIIHDSEADQFYDYMNKDGVAPGSAEFQYKYNDLSLYPDCKGRCIIPSDIDCFMDFSSIKNMMETLKKKKFELKVKKSGPANLYFFERSQDNNIASLDHTKLVVKFDCHDLVNEMFCMFDFQIEVDIIHSKSERNIDMYDVLSSNIDFECNSLIINSNNEYRLSKKIGKHLNPSEKIKKINEIINDIKMMKAIVVKENKNAIPLYRWEKMINKGWKTSSPYFEIVKDIEYDGHCIICHGDIETSKFHIKDCNCDARFHMGCYLNMNKHENFKSECPMCKAHSFINHTESILLQVFARRQGELMEDSNNTPPPQNHSSEHFLNNIRSRARLIGNEFDLPVPFMVNDETDDDMPELISDSDQADVENLIRTRGPEYYFPRVSAALRSERRDRGLLNTISNVD